MGLLVAAIIFGNPAFWLGLLALGIPLVIHLLTRRTPKKMIFPTLQFLRKAMARKSNLYRIRHWLLLLLRTALVLFVLLVFLKPVWTQGARRSVTDPEAVRTQVILLDASASMGYASAGVTPFAQAKVAVGKILAQHRPGDRINLIRMGRRPRSCLDEPSDTVFFVRKDLQTMVLSEEHAQINAALAEALRQLERISEGRKQIFLVSDFQRTNWSAVDFKAVGEGVELFFIPAGTETTVNRAVTDITIRPSRPTVGETVEIVCKVANYGDQACHLPLELTFREGATFRKELDLKPHSTVSASFTMRFHDSGQFEGELSIPDDGLAIDNTRFLALTVAEKVHILVVSDAPGPPATTGRRLLERAINPFVRAQQATAVASVIPSAELTTAALSQAQVVMLSEVNELSKRAAEVLVTYLGEGGSVVYFHVGGADAQNLNRLAAVSEGAFVLPFKLTGQVELRSRDRFATLAQANFDHRMLARFRESSELADLRFYRFFSTERIEHQGQVLMRFDDGNIAMAETTVGPGTLLLCNFSCSLEHSDLAKHTLFVPLVHEMIKHLRPSAGTRDAFVVGDACYMTVAGITAESELVFHDPAGRVVQGSADLGSQGAACFFPQAQTCGLYRVLVNDEVAGALAVNVDPLESNLDRLELSQLAELARASQGETVTVAGRQASLEQALAGKPLWPVLLMIAIGLLCTEQLVVTACR